ncbi:exo-1,4-beta-D-glucosaminidase [Asanoa hainanensis]|uniref:Exo-1,4-beta-D-glucosaminidase n=1 Tax=Asanoa hainanensis TaxID=560556 RepID=A0A239N479_9ACTN|nr:beta-mannosidase [Asanoa hainanensis]SNT49695.1 exo-1,4-beta-D-glucosaminidase [Asanoa hainanensis]
MNRRFRNVAAALPVLLVSSLLASVPATPSSASPAGVESTVDLAGQWQVQSSTATPDTGDLISRRAYSPRGWLSVRTNDAHAVGSVVAAQLQNIPPDDQCGANNIFYSQNLTTCQGPQPDAHGAPNDQYNHPWWFRTEFSAHPRPGGDRNVVLEVRGIMGQADLWVNGVQLATKDVIQGSEPEYTFDITDLVKGNSPNALAFQIYPNVPGEMLTQDFNDWTQAARDQNTGIKYPVRLHVSDTFRLDDAHVVQANAADLSSSDLTVKGTVTNTSRKSRTATVNATITDPRGKHPINLRKTITLGAGESRAVVFDPGTDSALHVRHPQVWWPYQMGDQPLYTLAMNVSRDRQVSDSDSQTFGIRTITSWLSSPGSQAYDGSRWFAVNGKPFVFRGGGMMDQDMFLRYSRENIADQVQLIKSMGLNGLRLEGDDQPDDFYEQMDRAGLLIYGGFLCCNYWEEGSRWTAKDEETNYRTAVALGRQQRSHPSVVFYSWSDNVPSASQEAGVLRGFAETDFSVPVMASAEYKSTPTLGPSGMKEGPYNWFPPSYAYSSNCKGRTGNDPCTSGEFVNRGGAWAFQTESSPGSTIPTKDSLDRFMTPADQTALVTSPNLAQFNSGRGEQSSGTSYSSFQHVGVLATAICQRYGTWTATPVTCPTNPPGATGLYSDNPSVDDFVRKAQAINYETVRAQFEAYLDHSTRTDSPSTGLVYWMMNKPMPSLLWNLYGYDFDQAGTFFGAKKANESLHVYYAHPAPEADPGNRTIGVSNLTGQTQSGLSVTARTYDMRGTVLTTQSASGITMPSQGVMNQLLTVPNPTLPDVDGKPQRTYFLELLLKRGGHVVDRNVYWLSTVNDVPTYTGSAYPNLATYGDLRNLQSPSSDPANGLLPSTTIRATAVTHRQAGLSDGQDTATDVTLTNTSGTVAFMVRVDVHRGHGSSPGPGDSQVRPASYSDNYVTLWPGQSQTISQTYAASELGRQDPVVTVSGFNVPTMNISGDCHCVARVGAENFGTANGYADAGNATPGVANTPETMASLKARVTVS